MFAAFRPFLLAAAGFSLVINLLLLAPMLFMYQVYDRVLSSGSLETLTVLGIVAAAALLLMGFLDTMRTRLMHGAAVLLDQRYGPRLMRLVVDELARPGSRSTTDPFRDLQSIRQLLTGGGVLAMFDAPWMVLYIVVIFLFHPILGGLAVLAAVIMLLLAYANDRATRASNKRMQVQARDSNRFFETVARNADVVAGMGMGEAATERWMNAHQGMLKTQTESGSVASAFSGATKFTRQFIQAGMLAVGAYLVVMHMASPGVVMAVTMVLGRALAPIEQAVANWRTWIDAFDALSRLRKLLDKEADKSATTALPRPEGEVTLEDVSLTIEQNGRWVIRNLSLRLEPGETLVVVGPSASGKSCLTRVLVGAWKASLGDVRLDGADVSTWDRTELGRYVGYLPQDVELFSGTIAENIARLQEPDPEEVIRAAKRARVHDMILRLPKGYDTQIGDGGAVLSGGQRQRVGFARALYGSPSMVVLDEPNANLDSAGEAALATAVKQLKSDGVTVVIVTQRLSILALADKVLAMRKGRAEFIGSRARYLALIREQREKADAAKRGHGQLPGMAAERTPAVIPAARPRAIPAPGGVVPVRAALPQARRTLQATRAEARRPPAVVAPTRPVLSQRAASAAQQESTVPAARQMAASPVPPPRNVAPPAVPAAVTQPPRATAAVRPPATATPPAAARPDASPVVTRNPNVVVTRRNPPTQAAASSAVPRSPASTAGSAALLAAQREVPPPKLPEPPRVRLTTPPVPETPASAVTASPAAEPAPAVPSWEMTTGVAPIAKPRVNPLFGEALNDPVIRPPRIEATRSVSVPGLSKLGNPLSSSGTSRNLRW